MSNRKRNENKLVNSELTKKDYLNNLTTTLVKLKFKNTKQKSFIETINGNEISICNGPAGTGKTFLSIYAALDLIKSNKTPYDKILISRAAVESGENLGYLPGDINEKIAPYLEPIVDAIDKLISIKERKRLFDEEVIKGQALAFIRGKSLDNTILIMDECQNMTQSQMKTLLTRIGDNSKFILSGDINQSDKFKNIKDTGLYDAMERLNGVEGVATFTFDESDIVRNPIISRILKKYT